MTIAQQLGLEVTTVSNFFMNARRRSMDKWKDQCDDDENSNSVEDDDDDEQESRTIAKRSNNNLESQKKDLLRNILNMSRDRVNEDSLDTSASSEEEEEEEEENNDSDSDESNDDSTEDDEEIVDLSLNKDGTLKLKHVPPTGRYIFHGFLVSNYK